MKVNRTFSKKYKPAKRRAYAKRGGMARSFFHREEFYRKKSFLYRKLIRAQVSKTDQKHLVRRLKWSLGAKNVVPEIDGG